MGMYDGINDPGIPTGGQRLYFQGGSYRCKVDVLKSIGPDDAFDGIGSFIAEVIITHSTNDMLRPGAVVGYVEKLKKKTIRKSFANIKGFLACAFGTDGNGLEEVCRQLGCVQADGAGRQVIGPDQKPAPDFSQLISQMTLEENPLRGMIVDLVCTEKPMREREGVFTVHHWHIAGFLDKQFGPVTP